MRAAIAILILVGVSQAAEWKQLFDGKSLDGWSLVGPGRFVVEDGMLKTEGGMGLLWYTGQPFANTTIRVVFKTASPNANSGVYIRFPEKPKDPWYAVHNGYEVQIDAGGDEWHCTGSIYSLSKVSKRNHARAAAGFRIHRAAKSRWALHRVLQGSRRQDQLSMRAGFVLLPC